MLNAQAQHVHVVPGLKGSFLLSIARLCDSGYEVLFHHNYMQILRHDQCILKGHRNPTNKLWKIDLECPPIPPIHQASGAAIGSPMAADLVAFAHATLFSPALSTLEKALDKGYLINFPGLTPQNLRRHPQ
jgi:hypothetical protein